MLLFSLPPRRSALTLPADPLTPAGYLVLRRTAAGRSRYEVANALRPLCERGRFPALGKVASADEALALVDLLERPGVKARRRETIELLAAIYPLDVDVYHQLATEPADRHPQICRGCGCSDHDPCTGNQGVCSWAVQNVCSRCLELGLTAAEAA